MHFFITYIFPILLGGFIGWFTNYLAIKMLFRPHKKLYFGKLPLPFTPGLIPKEKERIAESLSYIISKEFFSKDILKKYLTSKEMESKIKDIIFNVYLDVTSNDSYLLEIVNKYIDNKELDILILKYKTKISNLIIDKFNEHNLSNVIAKEVINNFVNNNENTLLKALKLFITNKVEINLENLISSKIENYLKNEGKLELEKMLVKELDVVLSKRINEVIDYNKIDIYVIQDYIIKLFNKFIDLKINNIIKTIDVEKLIYDRISELDVLELEKIILEVTKKELHAITFLGGVLGAILGVLNIFI